VVDNGPKHLVKTINRAKFEQLIQFYVDRTLSLIKSSMGKSGKNISDIDSVVLVGGSTRIPYLVENIEKYFGKKADKSLNPDTAISSGAAIQASVISGENTDILLLDVTALSFGIETMGQIFTSMIAANSTIPISKTQIFSTAVDNQPEVQINIATGERPLFNQNKFLGTFNLNGIMPARRGVPQIEVEFSIDANSILTVKAKDKATNKENKIRIEGSTSLTKEEIERMKEDAKINEESDKKEKDKIDRLNEADSLIFQTEKQIEDFGDKLNESDKSELNSTIEKLKESHKTQNLIDVERYSKELTQVWNRISQKMYSETTNNNSQSESNTKQEENFTDFEEVK
jgi:molecular chaperone DnaK